MRLGQVPFPLAVGALACASCDTATEERLMSITTCEGGSVCPLQRKRSKNMIDMRMRRSTPCIQYRRQTSDFNRWLLLYRYIHSTREPRAVLPARPLPVALLFSATTGVTAPAHTIQDGLYANSPQTIAGHRGRMGIGMLRRCSFHRNPGLHANEQTAARAESR